MALVEDMSLEASFENLKIQAISGFFLSLLPTSG